MPFYQDLKQNTESGRRTAERLLKLKEQLASIPTKTVDQTLLLATWNIRDFDKPAFGRRTDEAIYYIAEIISRFDIVAVQEVYQDLEGLNRVVKILGGYWKYLITDSSGSGQGNNERMTFLYDSRKISFGGFAGEMVMPPVKVDIEGAKKLVPAEQVWRTPYMCGFKAGWSTFMLASVHIQWAQSIAAPVNRVNEIKSVAQFLKKMTDDKMSWSRNVILMGDFNIFTLGDETFKMLTDAGFTVPEKLKEFGSNANKDRHYDQIAFRVHHDRLEQTGACGIIDYYQTVFRTEDEPFYVADMGNSYKETAKGKTKTAKQSSTYYKTQWRTHQMSDHLPMWVELKIDYSDRYLERKLKDDVPVNDPQV